MKHKQPKYHYDVEQGSLEWLRLRLGSLTATAVQPLFAKRKAGEFVGKGGVTLLKKKFKEILTGELGENISGDAIDWGHANEPKAVKRFGKITGCRVDTVGFVEWGDYIASSPDGLIGDTELLEIKCPFGSQDPNKPSAHLEYIRKDDAPRNYKIQMLHQLITTGRKACWFMSFDPRELDESKQVFMKCYTVDDLLSVFKLTREEYENRLLEVAQVLEIVDACCVAVSVEPAKHEKTKPAVLVESCSGGGGEPWDF